MAETKTHSPNTLRERVADPTLREASNQFYEVAGMVDEKLESEGSEINYDSPMYWLQVASTAKRLVASEYSTAETLKVGKAVELTAATPYFLFAQRHLNHMRGALAEGSLTEKQKQGMHNALLFVSHYNGLLRNYASFNPDITTPELNQHLTDTIEKAGIPHPETYQSLIADAIRGAQHEFAFGQILDNIGEMRPSKGKYEDLRGVDYVLNIPGTTKGIPIDVKSSPGQVASSTVDKNSVCGLSKHDVVVVHSMLNDDELNSSFIIDPELAKRKATELRPLLERMSGKNFAKRVDF